MTRRWLTASALVALIAAAWTAPAAANGRERPPAQLRLTLEGLVDGGSMTLLATVHNPTAHAVEDVVVVVDGPALGPQRDTLTRIMPGQHVLLQRRRVAEGAAYAHLRYRSNGTPVDVVDLVKPAVVAPASRPAGPSVLLTVLLSLGGVAVGGVLAHFLTRSREREQARREWDRMLFDKYEGAYVEFQHGWDGSTLSSVLERAADKLKQRALLSRQLARQLDGTRAVLRREQSTDAERREAAEQLTHALDRTLRGGR